MTVSAGLGIPNVGFDSLQDFWSWVDLCDAEGVDSLWQSDRIISSEPFFECMSTMAALAGRTKRVKFGMNAMSLGLRDPVLTAKACATIDHLSGGRLLPIFGVGSALSRDFEATGTPTKGRGKRTDESVEIMSRLWREERINYQGTYYQLHDASISPRPVQQPLPLWLGGSAKEAIERAGRWGTGWQGGIENAEQVGPVIAAIKEAAKRYERSIDDDHFGAGFAFRFGSPNDPVVVRQTEALTKRLGGKSPKGYFAVGDADDIMACMEDYRAVQAHKFVMRPMGYGTADLVQQTKRFIAEIKPRVDAINQKAKSASIG